MTIQTNTPKPFLQWVGGKRRIADQLTALIPAGLNNYYEPFLGGGALFFQVKNLFKQCFLSDINLDLVTSYNALKKNPEAISSLLEKHNRNHSREYYYQIRGINSSNNPDIISARFFYTSTAMPLREFAALTRTAAWMCPFPLRRIKHQGLTSD